MLQQWSRPPCGAAHYLAYGASRATPGAPGSGVNGAHRADLHALAHCMVADASVQRSGSIVEDVVVGRDGLVGAGGQAQILGDAQVVDDESRGSSSWWLSMMGWLARLFLAQRRIRIIALASGRGIGLVQAFLQPDDVLPLLCANSVAMDTTSAGHRWQPRWQRTPPLGARGPTPAAGLRAR